MQREAPLAIIPPVPLAPQLSLPRQPALTPCSPSQDPLPWATCPLNSNRTGYEEECEKTSSTQYFWYRQTLNISPSLEASGSVQWEQALCLTLAWLVVYLCILRGTASTGKVRAGHSPAEPGRDLRREMGPERQRGVAAVPRRHGISSKAPSSAASAALPSCSWSRIDQNTEWYWKNSPEKSFKHSQLSAKAVARLLAMRKAVCHSRAVSGDVYSLVFARKKRHLLDIFCLLFIHSRSYEEVGRKTPMSWLSLH